jgi:hypothetical protein
LVECDFGEAEYVSDPSAEFVQLSLSVSENEP